MPTQRPIPAQVIVSQVGSPNFTWFAKVAVQLVEARETAADPTPTRKENEAA